MLKVICTALLFSLQLSAQLIEPLGKHSRIVHHPGGFHLMATGKAAELLWGNLRKAGYEEGKDEYAPIETIRPPVGEILPNCYRWERYVAEDLSTVCYVGLHFYIFSDDRKHRYHNFDKSHAIIMRDETIRFVLRGDGAKFLYHFLGENRTRIRMLDSERGDELINTDCHTYADIEGRSEIVCLLDFDFRSNKWDERNPTAP